MKRVFEVPTIHCMGCVAVSFDTAVVDEGKIREAIQRSGHQVGS